MDVSQFRPGRIVSLYRYPHPLLSGQWLYVGQGIKRDSRHRAGRSSFGLRFKRQFPGIPLPAPIRWEEPATDSIEANNAETVAMFRYHTWHGYPGGMNLTLPGSKDYEELARIGGSVGGRISKEHGTGIFGLTSEQLSQAGRTGGLIGVRNMPYEAKVRGGKITGAANLKRMSKEARVRGCHMGGSIAGPIWGHKSVESGHLARIARLGGLTAGPVQGRKNVESGLLARICAAGGRAGGRAVAKIPGLLARRSRMGLCSRWNINRGKPCTCGEHLTSSPGITPIWASSSIGPE